MLNGMINTNKSGDKKIRTIILSFVFLFAFLFFVCVLFKIQVIDKDDSTKNTVMSYALNVDAARGEILDRNGSPLVTNRQGNSITFNYAYFPTDQIERDKIILSLIKLFESNNQEYVDNLPIYLNSNGSFAFEKERDSDIEWLKSSDMLDLNNYATADNCMTALVERYSLQDYSKSDALKIASVCVEMKKIGFSKSIPYTFAEDVPTDLVAIVMENGALYKGVENTIVPYREYTDGTVAPHILGRVSAITAEKYEAEQENLEKKIEEAEEKRASDDEIASIKRNAYTYNDEYGNSGLEAGLESYFRGKRGVKVVSTDSEGNVTEKYTVTPTQGNTVVTTLDTQLQKIAQEACKNRIESLDVESRLLAAAAVVVMDVNSGDILACATYPSYDNTTWRENYSTWAKDINSPLWNRALMSTYEPGSTFKPMVAVAALEEKTIDDSFTWKCTGIYPYLDHTFSCANHTAHGTQNVTGAINKSCNCFFYETSRMLGIEKIDRWATAFGLGQKTGVEVAEAQGILAGIEYRESQGGVWRPGDTLQAAIGQSDNQFTLIQLCNYCATIANGGTRYVPRFVKSIMSYDCSKTVLEKEPEVAATLDISKHTLDLVRQGMYLVGTEGFCKNAFAGLPVKAAAKTGTSEVKKVVDGETIEGNNGFLISYAPYENPEIAVAIVVETADTGSLTAPIAADIYDYYFSQKELQSVQQYSQLLS